MSLCGILGAGCGSGGVTPGTVKGPARVVGALGSGPVISHEQWSAGADYLCQARLTAVSASGTEVQLEGFAVTQPDVATITATILDMGVPGSLYPTPQAVGSVGTTPGNAILNSLVADDQWSVFGRTIDSIGRNVQFTVPGSIISGQQLYRVVVVAVLTDGTTAKWVHEIDAQNLSA